MGEGDQRRGRKAGGLGHRPSSAPPRPILILHSARDRVCTAEEAFHLARQAKSPFELHLMDGADHFMFVDTDPRVAQTLRL